MPTFRIPLRDGKLPEISVLDSKCLMAGEFGILFTQAPILTPENGYAVRALNLGSNPEASRALGEGDGKLAI